MAFDEHLEERIERVLNEKRIPNEKKKMFGGLTFMVQGKMSIGIVKDELMARVGPGFHTEALKKPGARTMDFTGKPMEGYVFVSPEGVDSDEQLDFWIQKCLEFNKDLVK